MAFKQFIKKIRLKNKQNKRFIKTIFLFNLQLARILMNSILLKNNTKVIQKNKKHYDVIILYCTVQIFSAEINLPSKPGFPKLFF